MKKLISTILLGFILASINLLHAQIKITGRVTDATDGGSMPSVTVSVKGGTKGTFSDVEGNYTISIPKENSVLVFSFLGYQTLEVPVGGKTVLDVALSVDALMVDEVVITAMGMEKAQKAVGYSVSSISAKDINKVGAQNVGSALYGKAAGVKIQTAPGGSTSAVSINIRGVNSLNYSNQPLVIVDGIPIRNGDAQTQRLWGGERIEQNGVVDINPEDIENISILKGAAASALYGSEATNGVVVISTKGGSKRDGIGVDLNVSYTWDKLAFTPKYQNTYGPGYPESFGIKYDDQGFYHSTVNGVDIGYPHWRAYCNFGPVMDGRDVLWWDGVTRPYSPQPNNYNEVFENGHTASYNIGLSNAGNIGSYRLSYTRNENKTIQSGSDNYKNSFSLNSTLNVSKFLSVDITANYYDGFVHNRPLTMNFLNGYSFSRADDPNLARQKYKKPDGFKYTFTESEDPTNYLPINTRITDVMDYYWKQLENSNDEEMDRLIASLTANLTMTNWLKLRARIGTDFTSLVTETKEKNEKPPYIDRNQGKYQVNQKRAEIQYGDLLLTGNQKFSDFNFSLSLGGNYKHMFTRDENMWSEGGLNIANWFSLNNSINNIKGEQSRDILSKGGVFGILGVDYKNFLFLEGTARYEQVSTLPPTGNEFFYPSISGSFIFSELWAGRPQWWDYSKIRLSYGIVGNEPTIYTANNLYTAGSVNGASSYGFSDEYGNDFIRPEKKHEYEVGLEFKFFNNRLGGEVTYYNNKIIDQIMKLDVPTSSGVTNMLTNLGEIKNYGLEASINATPIVTRDFSWNTRFNIGFNKNQVVKLVEGVEKLVLTTEGGYDAIQVVAAPGRPFGDIYALHHKTNDKGDVLVDDDGYWIRDNNYTHIGNSTPNAVGGWGNTFNYKNFFLDFLIDMRFGGQMFSYTNYYGLNTGRLDESLEHRDEAHGGLPYYKDDSGSRVLLPSHNSSAPNGSKVYHDGMILDGVKADGSKNETIIRAEDYYGNTFDWGQTGLYGKAVYDNSYIKFRELSIGCSLEKKWIKKYGFQKLDLSLIGRNLLYIYKTIPNIDPEAAIGTSSARTGIESGGSQPVRSIGFSIRASF